MRFLSLDEFYISFICDLPFLVIGTFLPFLPQNEDKVVNTGILVAGEEQSPHLSSHRGLKALNESPMMISGGDTPILDDCPDFDASRARGFCPSITRASHPQLLLGIQYPNLIDLRLSLSILNKRLRIDV
ncbi:hypothetical protein Tco_0182833, partial [Tanacetum coccineum]